MTQQPTKDFFDKFCQIHQTILNRATALEKKGFKHEIFMWYALLIEAELSLYLADYEKYIKLIGGLHNCALKNYNPADIEQFRDKTLGVLILKFSKVNGNEALIAKLRKFNGERIKIIHRFIDSDLLMASRPVPMLNNTDCSALCSELIKEWRLLIEEISHIGLESTEFKQKKYT